jgi:hypothetical protein
MMLNKVIVSIGIVLGLTGCSAVQQVETIKLTKMKRKKKKRN